MNTICPSCKAPLIASMRTHAPNCAKIAHIVCYTNKLDVTVKINAKSLLDARIIACTLVSHVMTINSMRDTDKAWNYSKTASHLKRGGELTMTFADETLGSVWID